MVGCLSICLSHRSTAATAAGGFAAEHPAGRRCRWIDVLQMSFCRRQRWAANAGSVMLRTDNQGSIRTCVNMQLEGSRVYRAGGDYDWLAYKFTETMMVFMDERALWLTSSCDSVDCYNMQSTAWPFLSNTHSSCFLACRLLSTYPTLCCKEIQVSSEIRVLPSETLSQTPDLENFASAYDCWNSVINSSNVHPFW